VPTTPTWGFAPYDREAERIRRAWIAYYMARGVGELRWKSIFFNRISSALFFASDSVRCQSLPWA